MKKSPQFDGDSLTQTTLPLTLGQVLAKPSTWCDMPCSRAEEFQSWGVTLDLPAPTLLQPHSHQLFISIVSPAKGPQLFLPNQTLIAPLQQSLCPAYRLCYHLQRANTSPNTCFTFWTCLHHLPNPTMAAWVEAGSQTHIPCSRNRCCELGLAALDEPREGKGAEFTRILLSAPSTHLPLLPSTPHSRDEQSSAHILGPRSRRVII